MIRFESFDANFDQADERTAKVGSLPAAPIDDYPDRRDLSAMRSHNVDCLLHPPSSGDHIFRYDKPLVRRDLESTPQHQTSRIFLREDVPLPESSAHLVANDDSTQGRRDHRVAFDAAQFFREPCADLRGDARVLQEQGALKELPAMQARAQDEMPIEERAGLAEERKQIVTHAEQLTRRIAD
jgi:hypothetical protein